MLRTAAKSDVWVGRSTVFIVGLAVLVALGLIVLSEAADAASSGAVRAWGLNSNGQLGSGTTTDSAVPVSSNINGIKKVAGGSMHSLALKGDGTVRAWGDNELGQLGDGTTTDRNIPVKVHGLTNVVAIAAGCYHSLALKRDGTVWAWGSNKWGSLGDGTTTGRNIPVKVHGLTNVVAIAAGCWHSLALKRDGTVRAWGDNYSGQLGDGTNAPTPWGTNISNVPVTVKNLAGIKAIDGGYNFSVALKRDGTVRAWGANLSGQLGDGTTTDHYVRGTVKNLSGVTALAAATGGFHILALKGDGTVRAWGDNYSGQLGDGTTTEKNLAVKVKNLAGVKRVAAGTYKSLALKGDGTVRAWGDNYSGQLGDGTTTPRTTPVKVKNLVGVTRIGAGDHHSLAVK